ncbi:chloramphenicol acetyltransferase (CAT-III) [Oceanicola granulosus HTCC2516]|uniref:Chloramphenicol acetyltransferase (CAT-III) n=1 Tax=Oceanicola granulosus (strain ATCC BAA-861 / DSM 15982 / KCTC 12143 / HTCC2516) TaxID=314256 RepID=Q2CA01_OCEGH|nr:CatA-like O-acetyltransferase [Oceanicola granulosus]EAR49509.1 chloramphenicol acetyltransferase (CAT-III) [Oceanicola granulosus HTCC2516]
MAGREIDLARWERAEQFRFFRGFERPHYAITARVDVSTLMGLKPLVGLSPFRTLIHAVGAGLHAVPALRTRFRGERVTEYDRLTLSPTIPLENGDFRYTYLAWQPDRAAFDSHAAAKIAEIRAGAPLNANDGSLEDVAYLSCLPWLDYSALDNALPHADDCIPRVSWGKIVPRGDGHDVAMTLQVHHALVDGRQVGRFFEATADALASLS